MIVLPDQELAIITPPRTASTSLHAALCREPYRGIYVIGPAFPPEHINQHTAFVPPEFGSFAVASTMRHPFDRLVSLWYFWLGQRNGAPSMSFKDFARVAIERKSLEPFYCLSISEWLYDVKIHQVLVVENLLEGVKKFGVRLAYIPHLHRTNRQPPWQSYYDAETLELVEPWAKPDLLLGNYPVENAPIHAR